MHFCICLFFFGYVKWYVNLTMGTEDHELSQNGKIPAFHMKCLYLFFLLNCQLVCISESFYHSGSVVTNDGSLLYEV
jgi:hypothetical protein